MNLLQTLKLCRTPDATRTKSFDEAEGHEGERFQAVNIDEQGRDVSRGVLQLNSDGIAYVIANKSPTCLPLDCIRRYGCVEDGQKLMFEVGRRCPTGQAFYAFRSYRAREFIDKFEEQINLKHSQQTSQQKFSMTLPPVRARRRKDASTSTESNTTDSVEQQPNAQAASQLKPLSYVSIDFETTKALNESAQAHAATRLK